MRYRILTVLVLVFGLAGALAAQQAAADQGKSLMAQGKDNYAKSRYQDAVANFRELLVNPNLADYRGDAYFWVAKSLMAVGRLDDASRNLEFFLANYKPNPNQAEALYLRGRILYLQSDFPGAIGAFAKFIEANPSSPFVPNAYYWTGESLYSMGQLDEAQKMFQIVIQEFPTSYRIEAARYRISLVELRKREGQLLELLKWSHQENIKNLEDFQKREKVYEEAIKSYQQRLTSLASDDFRGELKDMQSRLDAAAAQNEKSQVRINELNTQVRELQSKQADLERDRNEAIAQYKALQAQMQKPLSDALADIERRQRLLDAKEQALAIKEQALKGPEDAK